MTLRCHEAETDATRHTHKGGKQGTDARPAPDTPGKDRIDGHGGEDRHKGEDSHRVIPQRPTPPSEMPVL
ncbi:hypothetical protein GCM10010961_22280 [Pseudodonghicola xiamenensis]|uniref:Uncharacterized protein n=1 Tax=Pseudodonghicola xiamenensis TaxID=337702 RepID=A0A8J3MCE7_9RHOB|nr:hypothetical protein GCM10010961_22280 [Pseudodonghicola xiamenensis]